MKREIELMLKEGVIEPSTSDWASPIALVGKKDGTVRFCADYRQLNAATQSNAYPMPRVHVDELLDCLGSSQFLTTLDLVKSYWQVPVRIADRPITAFTTP